MSDRRFCSNCRHYRPDTRFSDPESRAIYARCNVAPRVEVALVSPELDRPSYCVTARQLDYMCGPAALRYEPRLDA